MKLVLIGHGYLGKAVARDFSAAGWAVDAISRHGENGTIACDVSRGEDVGKLPDADAVVHCAASGGGGAEAYERVYLGGCRNLLARYPGVPVFFTSSTSVYAQTDGSEVTEDSAADPERATGKVLVAAENLILSAGGTVARLAGIYGPGRSVLLQKFFSGQAIIEENGERLMNHIHRDDAAAAIFHLIAHRLGGIYNVADSAPMSQRAVYEALAETFDVPLPPNGPRDPHRKRGWTHKRVSNRKLRESGWEPRFPVFVDVARQIAGTLLPPHGSPGTWHP